MVLGIDASNLRAGGGLTHLRQLIAAADPESAGIEGVRLWGGTRTLAALPRRPWLDPVHVKALDGPLPGRLLWQQWVLPTLVESTGCGALLSPGGTVPMRGAFPKIAISQNLLPFERREAARFGVVSAMRAKLWLLARSQTTSFRRADGVVFLTQYARQTVLRKTGPISADTTLIPHGIEERFFCPPRTVLPPEKFGPTRPFRVLYVSIVDVYKHQWRVAEAIARLRRGGMAVSLEFVGPAYQPALRRLRDVMQALDCSEEFMSYVGPIPFEALHDRYRLADAFVFASSCENLPNILLEAMAAGLPIACADRGPMPEVLGDAGVYFNPEDADSIAAAVRSLYRDEELRERLACAAQGRARRFSWEACARDTFAFCARLMTRSPGMRAGIGEDR